MSEDQAREIYEMLQNGVSITEIANIFNTSYGSINAIYERLSFKDISKNYNF